VLTGRIFLVPGVVRFFAPAVVARLGVAMTGLAVFWAVRGASGSFGPAGAATGAFAIADAVVGPQIGRLVDRWGQRRVVPVTTSVFAVAAVLLIAGCARSSPGWMLICLAGVVGASLPPVGALSAARWRFLISDPRQRPAALSVDGAANDLAFLVGPVVVTTLSAAGTGWAGLAAATILVTAGVAFLIAARASEPSTSEPGETGPPTLTRPFLALFAVNTTIGLFFGGIGVVITAFAFAHQAPAQAGLITAASGVVSLTAGLIYGSVKNAKPLPTMRAAAAIITLGTAALALTPSIPLIYLAYALVGGCVALVLIPAAVLLQQSTPVAAYTQAVTWMNSASAIGIAIAAPIIGHVTQNHGWPVGFLVLAALTSTLPAAAITLLK
jgi:MFS family permease